MPPLTSRRQSPRLDPQGLVTVTDLESSQPIGLVDVSFGGFLARSAYPYTLDTNYQFVFMTTDGDWAARLAARALHGHDRMVGNATEYLTGFMFLDTDLPDVQARISALIDHLIETISFETQDAGVAPGADSSHRHYQR